jgi:fido (protein-threonine AMPylation protein)
LSNSKISIRFFDDREVRAVWDEQNAKWWFSVLDIVALLTDQNDYAKTRNYWKYLKARLKKENSQVVSATTQLKFLAPVGKSDYLNAMKQSPTDSSVLKKLLKNALTNKINDRDMFLKGIDYSYYYEENN